MHIQRAAARFPHRGLAPLIAGIGGVSLAGAVLAAGPVLPFTPVAALVLHAAAALALPGLWMAWRMARHADPGSQAMSADGWLQVVLGQLAVGMAGCILLARWEGLIVLPLMLPGLLALRAATEPPPTATFPWTLASRHRLAWVTLVDMYLLLAGLKLVWTAATPIDDLFLGPAWALASLCVVAALRFGSPGALLLSVQRMAEDDRLVVDGRVFARERVTTLLPGVLAFASGVAWLLGWRQWVRPAELFGMPLWPHLFLPLNLLWAAALMAVGVGLCRTRTAAPLAGIGLAIAALFLVMGRPSLWTAIPRHLAAWTGLPPQPEWWREPLALLAVAALLLFGWTVVALGAAWVRFRAIDCRERPAVTGESRPPLFPYFPG